MPIQVTCSSCGSRLKAPDGAVGRKLKCPKCGTAIPVVTEDTKSAVAPAVVASPAPPPACEPEPEPFHFQGNPPVSEEAEGTSLIHTGRGARTKGRSLTPIIVTGVIVFIVGVAVTLAGVAFLGKGTQGGGTVPQGEPGSRLTKENFLKITIGMPRDDVELILGPPTKRDFVQMPYGHFESYWQWVEGNKRIHVDCTTKDDDEAFRVVRKRQVGLD